MKTTFRTLVFGSTLAAGLLAGPGPEAAQKDRKGAAAAAPVDSLVLLEQAVAKDSTRFENLYRLGVLYMDRDRPNDAVRVLTRARQARPKDVRVLVNLGVAFDGRGSADQAQELYRQALELSPGDSVATCRLASSLYAQGNQTEAVRLLREVIRDKPRSYCAYFTLGVAFADAGIYREAIRMWRKVIEIAPDSPEAASARESIDVLEKFVRM